MSEQVTLRRAIVFPSAGQGPKCWKRCPPEEAGFRPAVIDEITRFIANHPSKGAEQRWALWRDGYLIHYEGDFNAKVDVASLRKTWHAMTVGAAIKQGKIPFYHQKISVWLPELTGIKSEATWWHVITQSAGFDYPYGDHPEYKPGEMWTYSDWNLVRLCHALAKVYGKKDFYDNYDAVAKEAYFGAIGLEGWSTIIKFDPLSGMEDGIRFEFNLDHLGRLGLLVLARGFWGGKELIPRWFVEELETKQTRGMKVNYDGPYDGKPTAMRQNSERFQEVPYGYLTWVNTDEDFYPGADRAWAWGSGAGGSKTFWNRNNGVVLTCHGSDMMPSDNGLPHIVERYLSS